MVHYGIVVHGGAGSPASYSDGCRMAAENGFRILDEGGRALDAAMEAARVLEDDERFNAGYGSVLRLDGKTIEMDASLMDSEGNIGGVIAIRNVKNPILVARCVMDTPHLFLAGEGAEIFARKNGFEPFFKVSERARERHQRMISLLNTKDFKHLNPRWNDSDIRKLWNFEQPFEESTACDTIGAVALDRYGGLAVANSTGGASPMMLGRVGDTPMPGCGFYAGPVCAVAATGIGEEIVKKMLARSIHERASTGENLKNICEEELKVFPPEIPVGVIAISVQGFAVSANREMAHFVLIKEK